MTISMLQPREQQRRRVLREMGITPWFPREASSTAARSHDVIFSLEETRADEPVPDKSHTTDSASAGKSGALTQARQLLNDDDQHKQPRDRLQDRNRKQQASVEVPDGGDIADVPDNNREVTQADDTVVTNQPVAFNFTWVNVDDRLALLAMMPGAETRIPAAQRDMMKRMLVALDPGIDTSNLRARLFSWPMPGLAIQDSAAATSAVNGFVAKQLNDRPVANLLVLSSALPVFLPSTIKTGQLSAWEPFKVEVLYTHAMHEMVDSPSTKREAWQHMQALRQRLSTG